MKREACVLAYSGGLDTSAIVPWLVDQGFEVHAVLVDVGQGEDLHALCAKARYLGAASAEVRDARAEMCEGPIPYAIALGATYEDTYRLGTALARPFIALEQVRVAEQLGGATLVHGATGKGNDQIRFEFAYRSLAPSCPVLAPWKVWPLSGRRDLIEYLEAKGFDLDFELTKEFSIDENLWHISVEGGPLEQPDGDLDLGRVLETVRGRFGQGQPGGTAAGRAQDDPNVVAIEFERGIPVAVDGIRMPLLDLLGSLNAWFRHASWAWDLVIENRFTGVKSRGLYINPAAKLLHLAVDGLARSCFHKPLYDRYVALGREYGGLLYRGEYFSAQRRVLEATADALRSVLDGRVVVGLAPAMHVRRIDTPNALFRQEIATFEAGEFSHADAAGFIRLAWLSSIGSAMRPAPGAALAPAADLGTAPAVPPTAAAASATEGPPAIERIEHAREGSVRESASSAAAGA